MGLELFHLRVVKTDYTRTMKEEGVPKKPLGCSFLLCIFTSLLEWDNLNLTDG